MLQDLILVDDEPIYCSKRHSVRISFGGFRFTLHQSIYKSINSSAELTETCPDLIITDVKMPQMDGLEFSAQAKKISPDAQIVILSGHDNFSYAQAALRLGASDYLLKPIKKKILKKCSTLPDSSLLSTTAEKLKNNSLPKQQNSTIISLETVFRKAFTARQS